MASQIMRIAALSLIACSGGAGSAGPIAPPPPAEELSFSEVAGEWMGEVVEERPSSTFEYQADLKLGMSASPGSQIGTIDYSGTLNCGGDVLALSARGDEYRLEEQIVYGVHECANGTIQLNHDRTTNTLGYQWFDRTGDLWATGVLRRRG